MKKIALFFVSLIVYSTDLLAANAFFAATYFINEEESQKSPHVLCTSSGWIQGDNTLTSEDKRANTLRHMQRFFEASEENPKKILFIPFAKVFESNIDKPLDQGHIEEWDDLLDMMKPHLESSYMHLMSYLGEDAKDNSPENIIRQVDGVFVFGGNTFQLHNILMETGMGRAIQEAVFRNGLKYFGGSAGANVASTTILTTNDMLIMNPLCPDGMGLLPFPINVHYYTGETYYKIGENFVSYGGETRRSRLEEFLKRNKQYGSSIVLLREGEAIERHGDMLKILGSTAVEVLHQNPEDNSFSTEFMNGETLTQLFLSR